MKRTQMRHSPFLPWGSRQFSWMHRPQADQEDTIQSVEQGILQSWEAEGVGPKHNVFSTGLETEGQKKNNNDALCHIVWAAPELFLPSCACLAHASLMGMKSICEPNMNTLQHSLLSSTLSLWGKQRHTKGDKGHALEFPASESSLGICKRTANTDSNYLQLRFLYNGLVKFQDESISTI